MKIINEEVKCADCKKMIPMIDMYPHAICEKCNTKQFKKAYTGDYEEAKRKVKLLFTKTY